MRAMRDIVTTIYDNSRSAMSNAGCVTCKYRCDRWCIKANAFRLCSTCDHRAEHKNNEGFDCLCVLSPTEEELKTGKCKYYKEYKDD